MSQESYRYLVSIPMSQPRTDMYELNIQRVTLHTGHISQTVLLVLLLRILKTIELSLITTGWNEIDQKRKHT